MLPESFWYSLVALIVLRGTFEKSLGWALLGQTTAVTKSKYDPYCFFVFHPVLHKVKAASLFMVQHSRHHPGVSHPSCCDLSMGIPPHQWLGERQLGSWVESTQYRCKCRKTSESLTLAQHTEGRRLHRKLCLIWNLLSIREDMLVSQVLLGAADISLSAKQQ